MKLTYPSLRSVEHVREHSTEKTEESNDDDKEFDALQQGGFNDRVRRFGLQQEFNDEQIAALLAIIRDVHETAVGEFHTADQSFHRFTDTLCLYGINRPPHSRAIWSPLQLRFIAEWTWAEYYSSFLLYQAISRPGMTLNLTTSEPASIVQPPPEIQPLQLAITEEAHHKRIAEEQELAKKREAERLALEREKRVHEHLNHLPDDLRSAMESYIDNRVQATLAQATEPECAENS